VGVADGEAFSDTVGEAVGEAVRDGEELPAAAANAWPVKVGPGTVVGVAVGSRR
jgi:hypothetical protein